MATDGLKSKIKRHESFLLFSEDSTGEERQGDCTVHCTKYTSMFDVLSAVNDGDSLLCQQLAQLITSVDSCC